MSATPQTFAVHAACIRGVEAFEVTVEDLVVGNHSGYDHSRHGGCRRHGRAQPNPMRVAFEWFHGSAVHAYGEPCARGCP